MESQPQNAESGRLLWLLRLIFRLSKHISPFKHEIIHFCRHLESLKNRISKVQDLGNFELSPMLLHDRAGKAQTCLQIHAHSFR